MIKPLNLRQFTLLCTFGLLFLSFQSKAAGVDTTRIVVLGTVHNSSDNFNPGKLVAIIDRIKPDLILVELDSTFFMSDMSFKPGTINLSLQNKAVAAYIKDHPVPVRPYEIEGRNRIYEEHDYFSLQKELSTSLKKAEKDSLLGAEAKTVLVICGFEHRYYLRNGLRERSSKEAILLKEYWVY